MSDNRNNMSPWFKIFALMIVGGVAKELFGSYRPAPTYVTQTVNKAGDALVDKIAEKGKDLHA